MKYVGLIKKALWGALAAGIVLGTSIPVYCTNYTSMEEYVKDHREQAEKAGYESTSDLSDWGITSPTNTDTSSSSTDSDKKTVRFSARSVAYGQADHGADAAVVVHFRFGLHFAADRSIRSPGGLAAFSPKPPAVHETAVKGC